MEKIFFDLSKADDKNLTAAILTQSVCQLMASGIPAMKAIHKVSAIYGGIIESDNEKWGILE